MYANTPLRDAYNREVFPNRAQPGAHTNLMSGGGPGAYDSLSTSSWGGADYATYQSGGGAASFSTTEWGPAPNNMMMPHDNFQPSNYAFTNPYNPAGSSDCNTCGSAGIETQPRQAFQQPVFYAQMVQEALHPQQQQQQQPTNYLAKVHQSANEMIVNFLKKNAAIISRQLKSKPDCADFSPDGGVTWKYSTMINGNSLWCRCFTRVHLQAERKASRYPIPYIACLTTITKIKLDCDLVRELQREFPMMSYCPITKELSITMDTLEHNLAVLALICACQQGKIDLDKIKYNELPKKYLQLTTPGHARYHKGAKYALVRLIRK